MTNVVGPQPPEPADAGHVLTWIRQVRRQGDQGDVAEVLTALAALRELREELASWEPGLILAARELGASWAQLAPALGVASRQAAERRYLRLRPSKSATATADERVQAVRDQRAEDRAITGWARQHSASLRQLAGYVSSLLDLSEPAQRRVDVVQRALADDDTATLLQPLADAAPHLRPTHPALAEQINRITEATRQVRRATQDRRSRPEADGAGFPTLR